MLKYVIIFVAVILLWQFIGGSQILSPVLNIIDSKVYHTTIRDIVNNEARIQSQSSNNTWQPSESDTLFLKNMNKIIKFDGYLVQGVADGAIHTYAVDRDGFRLEVQPPPAQTLQIGVPGMVLAAKYHLTGKLYAYKGSSVVIGLTNAEFICSMDQMNPNVC